MRSGSRSARQQKMVAPWRSARTNPASRSTRRRNKTRGLCQNRSVDELRHQTTVVPPSAQDAQTSRLAQPLESRNGPVLIVPENLRCCIGSMNHTNVDSHPDLRQLPASAGRRDRASPGQLLLCYPGSVGAAGRAAGCFRPGNSSRFDRCQRDGSSIALRIHHGPICGGE